MRIINGSEKKGIYEGIKLKLQGILHLLKQKIFLSNTLIVGFICFINQSQNDVPNFFLRVCAVLLIKNGEK